MNNPKEYWIFPQKGNDCEWTNLYPDASWRSETKPLVHVIEYSAYEQLQKRFDEAVKVLKFYANNSSWEISQCHCGTTKPKSETLGVIHRSDIKKMSGGKRAQDFLRSLGKENK